MGMERRGVRRRHLHYNVFTYMRLNGRPFFFAGRFPRAPLMTQNSIKLFGVILTLLVSVI